MMTQVQQSYGHELLYEPGWRAIAASASASAEPNGELRQVLGKSLNDYPVYRPYLASLDDLGLFEGRVAGLKIDMQYRIGSGILGHRAELWPLETCDGGTLVIACVHRYRLQEVNTLKQFRIVDLSVIPWPKGQADLVSRS
ncbi:MAG TPA: hypothetical protein DCL54_17060 [Alphaproteobacteria bacterium]|nr:hypothetical protein [Alphaproteobacteria bacterium]HAJ48286.1 hypothetical protein [Alphaproteobacteria bacterium]